MKKVLQLGEDSLKKWFKKPSFRKSAVIRCDRMATHFACDVELRGPNGEVVYKVFGSSSDTWRPGIPA